MVHIAPIRKASELAQLLKETDCVIFDFDGVVADSEPISLSTLQQTLSDFGVKMSLDQVRAEFLGKSRKTIEGYLAKSGSKPSPEIFANAWHKALFAQFRLGLCPIPGVLDVLDAMDQAGLPFCVASSSSFERLGVALDVLGLRTQLRNLFSADQVANGKPAPDLFLFAASQMQVNSKRCLVIEDSPYGISAAVAAGMPAIGFLGGSHLKSFESEHSSVLTKAGATLVLQDYSVLTAAVLAK